MNPKNLTIESVAAHLASSRCVPQRIADPAPSALASRKTPDAITPGKWKVLGGGLAVIDKVRCFTVDVEAVSDGGFVPVAIVTDRLPRTELPRRGEALDVESHARLIAAAPEMLAALEYAAELVKTARSYFPKSIKNSDKFNLENTCATIGNAIHSAKEGQ